MLLVASMTPWAARHYAAALALIALGAFSVLAVPSPWAPSEPSGSDHSRLAPSIPSTQDAVWAASSPRSSCSLVTEGLLVAEAGDGEELSGPQHLASAYLWLDQDRAREDVRVRALGTRSDTPFRVLAFPSRAPPLA